MGLGFQTDLSQNVNLNKSLMFTSSFTLAYARASWRGRPTIQLGMEQVRPGNFLIK